MHAAKSMFSYARAHLRIIAAVICAGFLTMACGSGAGAEERVFIDPETGFRIDVPAPWHMETGEEMREMARREAEAMDDPDLEFSEPGGPVEPLVRIRYYESGKAPGPNPTLVVNRFDLDRFPPGMDELVLLQMGFAGAEITSPPSTRNLQGRTWNTLTAMRTINHPQGGSLDIMQTAYTARDGRWAIGFVLSAAPEQMDAKRDAFEALLNAIRW